MWLSVLFFMLLCLFILLMRERHYCKNKHKMLVTTVYIVWRLLFFVPIRVSALILTCYGWYCCFAVAATRCTDDNISLIFKNILRCKWTSFALLLYDALWKTLFNILVIVHTSLCSIIICIMLKSDVETKKDKLCLLSCYMVFIRPFHNYYFYLLELFI